MYESLIYDDRDKNAKIPESTLGQCDTLLEALSQVQRHLVTFPDQIPHIYKVQIVTHNMLTDAPEARH